MMRKPPPYCQGFTDRHGKARWYLRRPGFKREPLPGLPWSPTFMAAYEAAMKGQVAPGSTKTVAGTIDSLVVSYYRSGEWLNLKPITQKTYRSTIEPFRNRHGSKTVANLKREHIKAILAELADRPVVANNWLKTIKILMRHSVEIGLRGDDPTLGIRKMRTGSTGYATWMEDHIEQFRARHPEGTKARLALELLLYTGQRRSDVVRMGWQHVKEGVITVRQSKTGTQLEIPMHWDLRRAIETAPNGNLTFLLTDYGKPFTSDGFGNWFRDRVVEAQLPLGLAAHGLRKAACRRLAEAGCTAPQIMAFSGHKNLKEVQTYIQAAEQLTLGRQALVKLTESHEDRTKIVKPASKV